MSQKSKSVRFRIFKGTVVLSGGQAATQILSFARNIIVARLLSPEDMGIAATFAITITLLEMISNLGVDLLLVQAKDGDDPILQGTAHFYQVIRGFSIGLIIFASAPIITWLFKTPEAEWAFRLLALVPVLRGFMHLDWKRLQREMKYESAVFVELIPQAIITFAAYPLAVYLGDYSTILWLVLMQAGVSLLVSHLFAQRTYQLNWDREYAIRLLVFGWPLLINGLLIFAALQGDRLIIGTFYSMSQLGVYSVAFSLVLVLVFSLTKMSTSLFLPLLAKVQDQHVIFIKRYVITVQLLAIVGGVVALPFVTSGGELIVFIFGKQYIDAMAIAPWLGALLLARIFRLAPTVASLALGDTKNSMYANLFRLIGVFGALLVAWHDFSLTAIVICGFWGEVAALLYTIIRLKKYQDIAITSSLYGPIVVSAIILLAGLNIILSFFKTSAYNDVVSCVFFYMLLGVVVFFMCPLIRIEIQKFYLQFFPSKKSTS